MALNNTFTPIIPKNKIKESKLESKPITGNEFMYFIKFNFSLSFIETTSSSAEP